MQLLLQITPTPKKSYSIFILITSLQRPIDSRLTKPELRPAHAPLLQRPQPLPDIVPSSARSDVDREEMVEKRVRHPRIGPLQQIRERLLPLIGGSCDRILERLIEADRVRQRSGVAKRELHVAQVVHRHARDDDLDVLLAQLGHGLAEAVVLDRVFRLEEGYLYDGDVEGIRFGIES